jgi:hypothetical protein
MNSIINLCGCKEISMVDLQACNCILIFLGIHHNVNSPHYIRYVMHHVASHGPCREHLFPVSPLVHVRYLLSSNRHCLQCHYLAMILHATI